MGKVFNLNNRENLLHDLLKIAKVHGTARTSWDSLAFGACRFLGPDGEVLKECGFLEAMEILVRDLYWDEEGNWSDAVKLDYDPRG